MHPDVDPDGDRETYLINLGWQVQYLEYFKHDPPWCCARENVYPYPHPYSYPYPHPHP